MEKKNTPLGILLFRVAQPILIVLGFFTYVLGMGIVHYLGAEIDWITAILGFMLIGAFILARSYLNAYFGFPDPIHSSRINRKDSAGDLVLVETKEIPKHCLLQFAFGTLAMGTVVATLLVFRRAVNFSVLLVFGICLLLIILDSIPPLRLKKKGYSELIEAVLIANMSPVLAFLLQGSNLHLLVVMFTIPLTFLYLAERIASSLQYYAYDTDHRAGSVLALIGWQRGMVIHNLSILIAFLLTAAFLVLGLPWRLAWPVFLTLPLGILQIFQISRIADRGKPNWSILRLNALGTFNMAVYLIAYTLWIS
jgi:1,4-dihydroxy-2-naphthoate octaprenyltransferase